MRCAHASLRSDGRCGENKYVFPISNATGFCEPVKYTVEVSYDPGTTQERPATSAEPVSCKGLRPCLKFEKMEAITYVHTLEMRDTYYMTMSV